jgi:protein N-terminal methyltransferase
MEIRGSDDTGKEFESLEQLWQSVSDKPWYSLANTYWSQCQPTVSAVLGGFEEVHDIDIPSSARFLSRLTGMGRGRAVDCGAGMGRVSKSLLVPMFERVDLVEQSESLLAAAPSFIDSAKAEHFWAIGLQDFRPPPETYDCVWCQWVLSHLTDEDLVSFLERMAAALKPGGFICIKENVKKKGFLVHTDDFSVTRSEPLLRSIIQQAGLQIVQEEAQLGFTPGLLPVKMFAVCRSPSLLSLELTTSY